MASRTRLMTIAATALTAAALAGCGGNDDGDVTDANTAPTPVTQADLDGVKDFLLAQSQQLQGFTKEFRANAEAYHALARKAGFDDEQLWSQSGSQVRPLLENLKASWIEGNPAYERMEGIVAGTPSLARYDVILDAGSSASEDPASAVPFDLTLPNGTVLKQPGNLYNLTEGALWGTLPDSLPAGTPTDLDGDGTEEFGEVLPDSGLLVSSARAFDRYAGELDQASRSWQPSDSDAFTALVVMVPTMSEYFGQWKESRFVLGGRSDSQSFNVVSRLSDISDILAGLDVVYDGVAPRIRKADVAQAGQTRQRARPSSWSTSATCIRASSPVSASRRSRPRCSARRRRSAAPRSQARSRRRPPRSGSRSSSSVLVRALAAAAAAVLVALAASPGAADASPAQPWQAAADIRRALTRGSDRARARRSGDGGPPRRAREAAAARPAPRRRAAEPGRGRGRGRRRRPRRARDRARRRVDADPRRGPAPGDVGGPARRRRGRPRVAARARVPAPDKVLAARCGRNARAAHASPGAARPGLRRRPRSGPICSTPTRRDSARSSRRSTRPAPAASPSRSPARRPPHAATSPSSRRPTRRSEARRVRGRSKRS